MSAGHYTCTVTVWNLAKLKAKDVSPNINRTKAAERDEKCRFCSGEPWPLTLTFELVSAKDQTRLPCQFGANPFSGFRDISYTNEKSHSAKNRILRSSLRAVMISVPYFLWPSYGTRQAIIFLSSRFFYLLLLSFFLAYSQPSQIGCLPYFRTWCGLSANISPKMRHLRTGAQLCRAIFSQLRHISTIGKTC